jgi:hypothetical protein
MKSRIDAGRLFAGRGALKSADGQAGSRNNALRAVADSDPT